MPLRARPARASCPAPPSPARPASRCRTRLAMPSLLPPRPTEPPVRRKRRDAAASLPRAAGPAGTLPPPAIAPSGPARPRLPSTAGPAGTYGASSGRAGPGKDPADPRDAHRRRPGGQAAAGRLGRGWGGAEGWVARFGTPWRCVTATRGRAGLQPVDMIPACCAHATPLCLLTPAAPTPPPLSRPPPTPRPRRSQAQTRVAPQAA
jgi:hypothetical protein